RTFCAGGRDGRGPRPRTRVVRADGGVRAGAREAAVPRAVPRPRRRHHRDQRRAAPLHEGGAERTVLPDAEHAARSGAARSELRLDRHRLRPDRVLLDPRDQRAAALGPGIGRGGRGEVRHPAERHDLLLDLLHPADGGPAAPPISPTPPSRSTPSSPSCASRSRPYPSRPSTKIAVPPCGTARSVNAPPGARTRSTATPPSRVIRPVL